MRDPYEVLGVDRSATQDEIKSAFRRLASQHHPDKNPGDEGAHGRFQEINAANQILSDSEKRATFDRWGHDGPPRGVDPFVSTVATAVSEAPKYHSFDEFIADMRRKATGEGVRATAAQQVLRWADDAHAATVRGRASGRVFIQTEPVKAAVITAKGRGFKVTTPMTAEEVVHDGRVTAWRLYNPANEWEEFAPADQVITIRVLPSRWVDELIVTLAWARRVGLPQFVEGGVVNVRA